MTKKYTGFNAKSQPDPTDKFVGIDPSEPDVTKNTIFDAANVALMNKNNAGNIGLGVTPTEKFHQAGGNILQDARAPTLAGFLKDQTKLDAIFGVFVVGNYAFTAALNSNTFSIIDVSDKSNIFIVGSITDGTNLALAKNVFVVGDRAYVISEIDRFSIIDITDKSNPTILSTLFETTDLDKPYDLYVSGKYAYVSCETNDSVTIIDLSDDNNPVIVGIFKPGTGTLNAPKGLYVVDDLVYVAAFDNLVIIDVSDPTNPVLKGNYTSDPVKLLNATGVYVSGRYAYVVGNTGDSLVIVDISDPTTPTQKGFLTDAVNLNGAIDVCVAGKYAYIASQLNFSCNVIDISDPTTPVSVGILKDNTNLPAVRSITVSGKFAYFGVLGNDAITVLDISGIDVPSGIIGSLESNVLTVRDNAIIRNNLYAGEINTNKIFSSALTSNSQEVGVRETTGASQFTQRPDLLILVDTSAGNTSVTLEDQDTIKGRIIEVKDATGNAGINNISIISATTAKIDNKALDPYILNSNDESVQFKCNGTDWFVIGSHNRDASPSTIFVDKASDIPERVASTIDTVTDNGSGKTRFTTTGNHNLKNKDAITVLNPSVAAYGGFHNEITKISDTVFDIETLTFTIDSTGTVERTLKDGNYRIRTLITTGIGYRLPGNGNHATITADFFTREIGFILTADIPFLKGEDFLLTTIQNIRIDTDNPFGVRKGSLLEVTGNPSPFVNPSVNLFSNVFTGFKKMGVESDLIHQEVGNVYLFCEDGYVQTGVLTNSTNLAWESLAPPVGGTIYTKKGQSLFQGANSIKGAVVSLQAGESFFNISPDIGIEDPIQPPILIGLNNTRGPGDSFKPGAFGNITSYADALKSGSVTATADVGGVAEFTSVAHGMNDGQKPTQSTFAESTYNVRGVVFNKTNDTYQLKDPITLVPIAFVASPGTGSFNAPATRIETSAAHGQSNGTPVKVEKTINNSTSDAMFNVAATFFETNKAFTVDDGANGTWNVGSLDQTDIRVKSGINASIPDTVPEGISRVNGNTTSHTPGATFGTVLLGTAGNAAKDGKKNVQFIVTDELTGKMKYFGKEELAGSLSVSITATSAGGSQIFRFTVFKNGVVMDDEDEAAQSIGNDTANISFSTKINLVEGDELELRDLREAGSSSLTISQYSMLAQ